MNELRRPVLLAGVAIVALLLLACAGLSQPMLLIATIAFGWIGYLARVTPQIQVNWGGVATAAVCLFGVIVVGHLFCRWIAKSLGTAAALRWQFRWTASIIAIVLLMFVSGIGAVGITHQSIWLLRSEQPIFESPFRVRALRAICSNKLQQIGQAIQDYSQRHDGRFPDSLGQLSSEVHLEPEALLCLSENGDRQLTPFQAITSSYVYRGRGLRFPLAAKIPIVCEPLSNHRGEGMNVLFSDGEVRWMSAEEAQRLFHPSAN